MPILTNEERIGTVLADKYKIVRVLGEGGMGVVFEGLHEFTQRRVAVKLLHAHLSKNEGMVERFMREARAAAALKHRNVVDVLDMGREGDGQVYLVLEFLTGEPLSALLRRRGKLSPETAAEILMPIMAALRAAHARGIIHRDIKPDNVFIARDEETGEEIPKLLDFGIAKIDGTTRATSTGQAIGTPAYMAPEQATNASVVDARADIWSLGVLWFEALTGRLPYKADTVMQMLGQLLSSDPMRLSEAAPEVPSPLTQAVERAMVRDREARWPSLGPFMVAVRDCFPHVDLRGSMSGADSLSLSNSADFAIRDARALAMEQTLAGDDRAAQSAAVASTLPSDPPSAVHTAQTTRAMSGRVAVALAIAALALLGGVAAYVAREPTGATATSAPLPSRRVRGEVTAATGVTPTLVIPRDADAATETPETPSPSASAGASSQRLRPRRIERATPGAASPRGPAAPAPAPAPTPAEGTERVRVMNW